MNRRSHRVPVLLTLLAVGLLVACVVTASPPLRGGEAAGFEAAGFQAAGFAAGSR